MSWAFTGSIARLLAPVLGVPLLCAASFCATSVHASTESGSDVSQAQFPDPRVPLYNRVRPNWAFQIDVNPIFGFANAADSTNTSLDTDLGKRRGIGLGFEYQPAFLQSIGVLGIGLNLTLFPMLSSITLDDGSTSETASTSTTTTPVTTYTGAWTAGGQIRYQMKYFRGQVLVPMGGYQFGYFSYNLPNSGLVGNFITQGPFFGAMLLLNPLEKDAASDMYFNYGISRTYLVGEYRLLSGGDANLSIRAGLIYAGLRFEF